MKASIPNLSSKNIFCLTYHNIFDFPLTFWELIKWEPGKKYQESGFQEKIDYGYKDGYFFLKKRRGLILSRTLRRRISINKLKIVRKAGVILKRIPTIKLIAVTGALAMLNAKDESDIDLLVVTQKGTLWLTRLISLLTLRLFGIRVRKYGDKKEKDKLCLNMWFDENFLVWPIKDRNFYTAHEIAQIVSLVNKDKTLERLLFKNSWLKDFWPNSVKIKKIKKFNPKVNPIFDLIEPVARGMQYLYMRKKRTREVITKNRAIFHPIDWSLKVSEILGRE